MIQIIFLSNYSFSLVLLDILFFFLCNQLNLLANRSDHFIYRYTSFANRSESGFAQKTHYIAGMCQLQKFRL